MLARRRVEEDHLEKLLEILRCRLRKYVLKKVICSSYRYGSRAMIYIIFVAWYYTEYLYYYTAWILLYIVNTGRYKVSRSSD